MRTSIIFSPTFWTEFSETGLLLLLVTIFVIRKWRQAQMAKLQIKLAALVKESERLEKEIAQGAKEAKDLEALEKELDIQYAAALKENERLRAEVEQAAKELADLQAERKKPRTLCMGLDFGRRHISYSICENGDAEFYDATRRQKEFLHTPGIEMRPLCPGDDLSDPQTIVVYKGSKAADCFNNRQKEFTVSVQVDSSTITAAKALIKLVDDGWETVAGENAMRHLNELMTEVFWREVNHLLADPIEG
jgi:hypothetical protein